MSQTKTQTKQPRKKPRYNLWQNTCWMIKLGLKTRWQVVALTAAIPLLALGVNLMELYIAPAILRQVENHAPLERLAVVILLFTAGIGGLAAVFRWCNAARWPAGIAVRSAVIRLFQKKAMTMSYPLTEDPGVQDQLENGLGKCGNNDSATEASWRDGSDLIRDLLGFAVYLFLLSALDPMLAVIVIATALAGALVSRQANTWANRGRDKRIAASRRFQQCAGKVSERPLGKDIRLFGMKPWVEDVIDGLYQILYDIYQKRELVFLLSDCVGFIMALLRNGAAYWYLISMTLREGLPASTFLLYFTAVGGFAAWVTGILNGFVTMHRYSLDLSAIREALEIPDPFLLDGGKPLPAKPDAKHRLELRDVTFRYPGAEKDTLRGVNLSIAPGEKLAIVGLNGAGKTTLIKLLCGFYDPTKGQVLLDGEDIRQYNRGDYYKHFAGVFQDHSLLEVSVRDNIVPFGQPCDQARLEDCIEKAGLTQKIASLPKGYDTACGRQVFLDGTDFSGGETQRLLLARALYRNSPILVLDEPTAALDPLAEHDMYMKYDAMCAGKTSVYISHRLASTRFCDRIILLEDGVIAEEGTHDQLIAAGGKYAELFHVQSRYYTEGGDLREKN